MGHFPIALEEVLGKTIERVFVAKRFVGRMQLFLVFTDGTYYELYGSQAFEGGSGVYRGDAAVVRDILSRSGAWVTEIPGGAEA
jgi:hypothetical protein